MTERNLIIPQERELQRRVKELEKGLHWIAQYASDFSVGEGDDVLRRIKTKADSLLSNSGAPKEKP